MRGKIVKGIGGLYYVCTPGAGINEIFECRAKGAFRREGRKPLPGDVVEMDVLDEEKRLGNIRELLPRHSELIRPAVANADQALVIFSVVSPAPSFNLLDRFLVMMGQQGMDCIICFNKSDADMHGDGEKYRQIYRGCGYRSVSASALRGEGIEELKALLEGKTTVVAGPSGVGKSSMVNCLQKETVMRTGELSAKIERGKHTTRHTELICMGKDTFILDTPGFSSLDLFHVKKEELSEYYPEFARYGKECRFCDCVHLEEPGCGVKKAVSEGLISSTRYENYKLLYEELDLRERRFSAGTRKANTRTAVWHQK